MSAQTPTIAPGFGRRLREERDRLAISQAVLAETAGIKRLAQGQYESEASSPTVRYLAAIGSAGVDLQYVLFARRTGLDGLSMNDHRRIEKKAFDLVEDYAKRQPDGQFGSEGRYAMFELFRAYLARCEVDGQPPALDPTQLIPGYAAGER